MSLCLSVTSRFIDEPETNSFQNEYDAVTNAPRLLSDYQIKEVYKKLP